MIDVTHICICLDYPKLYKNMATGNDVTSHENDLLFSVCSFTKLAQSTIVRGYYSIQASHVTRITFAKVSPNSTQFLLSMPS